MPAIKALGRLRQKDQELKGPNNKAILRPKKKKIARLSKKKKQNKRKTKHSFKNTGFHCWGRGLAS